MPKSTVVKTAAWALALAIVLSLGWWGYKTVKKRDLEKQALALVQDATVLLREALGLVAAGVEVRGRLEASSAALQASVRKVQALDASLNPGLVRAADAYMTDVQALLRRLLEAHKARDAVRADIAQLSDHLRAAGERSSAWIGRALELKKRMEKDFFDYRFAGGGLDKSFGALREARKAFEPLAVTASVIDELLVVEAQQRMQAAATQLGADVEKARQLPLPR